MWCQDKSQAGSARGSETARTLWASTSVTTISPVEEEMATPVGSIKMAEVPVPSARVPLLTTPPASDVTTPSGVIRRRRKLPWSAMTILLLPGSSAMLRAPENEADVPEPSAKPHSPPAKVDTLAVGVMRRMRQPIPPSPTTITPEGSTKRPRGSQKRASAPTASM